MLFSTVEKLTTFISTVSILRQICARIRQCQFCKNFSEIWSFKICLKSCSDVLKKLHATLRGIFYYFMHKYYVQNFILKVSSGSTGNAVPIEY